MINENQRTVYGLIISQLRYDGFVDISSQLEEYTCIQTRPKNHLSKLVESVEYQWKITSIFVDSNCIPSLLSKRGSNDKSTKHSFNSDSRKTYSEINRFVSKSSSNNFNSFRECVTNPCDLAHAPIRTHFEPDPTADLPSINSNNFELCKDDGSDNISCDDDSLDHSSPDTDMNHKTDNESKYLYSQYSIDGLNEFDESDDSSTNLDRVSDESVVDLTNERADDALYKSNSLHGLENVYPSPCLVNKSAESGSEHVDKAIQSLKCSSLQMTIKSTQRCSDEDTTEVSHSYSRNDASKSFPKGTKSSFSFQNATDDEIALIFEMFEGKSMTKTAFKAIVDDIIPSIACCTVEQQLSVMLGEHVSKYSVTSENEIRLRKKYSKMTKSGLLSSIRSVLGKSEIETDCNLGLVSNSCKIYGINPGNTKSDRDLNLQHTVAQQLLSGRDEVNSDCNKEDCEKPAYSYESANFSEAVRVKIIEFIYQSTTLLCTTFRKEVNRIIRTDSYTIQEIICETFGKKASHYIQFEYKDGCLKAIFLKNPWQKKSLVDILDSLKISKCLVQGVHLSKESTRNHVAQKSNKVSTEIGKDKASKPVLVTKIKRLDNQSNNLKSQEKDVKQQLALSKKQKTSLIKLLLKNDSYTFREFLLKGKTIIPALSVDHTAKDIIIAIFSAQFSHYIHFRRVKKEIHLSLKLPWKGKTSAEILNSVSVNNSTKAKGNIIIVLSNNDKLLIIDLIKKGSKTFEVFKAEADSLVASSKLTDLHGLMVSLFGNFIHKYVCLENGRICLMKRFKLTPAMKILDSINKTANNCSVKSANQC